MLKRVFCIVTSLTLFLIISFSPLCLSSNASKYEHISPYSDFKFSADTSQYFYSTGFSSDQIDFYFIVATAEGSSFKFRLFTIKDFNNYGILKIQRDVLPSKTFLLVEDYGIRASSWVLPSSDGVVEFDRIKTFGVDVFGFVFDYYNSEKYPSYNGSSTYAILASNVDIYDYNGRLLQTGNYDTFLNYFDGNLNASKIKNYTSASDPQTTTTPSVTTTLSGDGGLSGGGGSHRYEEENSKGIFDTLKEIFASIKDIGATVFDIPQHIDNLGTNFKQYLEYLFIPSDNNNFTKIKTRIETKFGFISQIIKFLQDFNKIIWTDQPPDTKIDFSSAHHFDPNYDFEVNFINLELYNRYKPMVDALIIFFSYFFFIRRLLERLPGIIGGFGL